MLVLIDESGDAAFKIAQGSTPVFVISMVVFEDFKVAEDASKAISELRAHWRLKKEFRFSNCADHIKDAFFAAVAPFEFRVCALVVEKSAIYSVHLRENKEHFYNFFLQKLLGSTKIALKGAIVKLDGKGDKIYRKELGSYLRTQLDHNAIKKFKFADSANDSLIQLADMVAGAIARSYRSEDRRAPGRWRAKLQGAGRLTDVWEFK